MALALIAIAVSLPLAVSSDLVRDRLERDIGAWAGHPVSLGNAPSMSFWPLPTIKLDNVEISPSSFADGDPIMRADSIVANFNLFSAILGAPSFSEFKLVRPTFSLEIYPDGTSNWASLDGELSRGIKSAVALDVAAQSGQPAPEGASVPASAALGTVEIEDGTVQWIRDPGAPAEKLTAVNGTVSWTSPTAAARVNLSAIIRGEQVAITTTIGSPLLLLGQRATSLEATLASAPLNLSFNGTLNLAPEGYFNGSLKLKSPSVRRALEWSGTEIKPGDALGALEMTADISAGGLAAKLDNLTIMIDQNRGTGVLDVELPAEAPPTVGGTLAFNTLDITSFLKAFTPLPKAGDDIASTIDTRFLREIGLDLRLSAQTARFGPVVMSNLAAAARVEEGRAMFDIGDATAYGGNLTGRIAISEKGVDGGAKLRISARNTDFGKLFDAMDMTGPLPRGIGTLDLEVASPYPTWATSLADLTGKIKLTLGKGVTPGFDLARFKQLARTERFFGIADTATGSPFTFNAAEFEVDIAGGQAELTRGDLIGTTETITLSGVVPYSRGSLAIAGVIGRSKRGEAEAAPAVTQAEPPLRFFVGGSWPQPVFSPVAN
ncbi:AsmA protein [Hoeflea marina]|uniref:AsmA protein n=2 Tax=Hoeflea marina TaxID=274592 RepID=A0A317PM59_9HYPH|nr:AsmA protein [Hoeflea marina]